MFSFLKGEIVIEKIIPKTTFKGDCIYERSEASFNQCQNL
jgi:hypothetical protein